LGANSNFIQKPHTPDQLTGKIRELLDTLAVETSSHTASLVLPGCGMLDTISPVTLEAGIPVFRARKEGV
jgi:hypothetical protein